MNLRESRVSKLLSARELAEKSGVSESNIYAIENGNWLPSLGTIKKLVKVLEVEPLEVAEFKASIEANSKKKS